MIRTPEAWKAALTGTVTAAHEKAANDWRT